MGKPSIFSNDYGQRMKKRKKMTIINTILVILILVSGAYFGGSYYLEKKGIDFGISFKSSNDKIQDKQDISKGDNNPKPNTDTSSSSNDAAKQPDEKTTAYYEYKAADGRLYKLEYTELSGIKEFTGVKSEVEEVQFDISADKRKIVFSTGSGDVVVGDELGVIIKN